MDVYTASVQRALEAQLVEVGTAYRQAIKDYYLSAPDGKHRYPERLEDLLKDSRHAVARRYIRRIHLDPMTSTPFVALIAPQGGVWGVSSRSTKKPMRSSTPSGVDAAEIHSYADWKFIFDGSHPRKPARAEGL